MIRKLTQVIIFNLGFLFFSISVLGQACPPGQYKPDAASPCTTCPAGSYCPGDDNRYLCDAGTWNPNTGATACIPCPPSSSGGVPGATMIEQCFILLPARLIFFNADAMDKKVAVSWATSAETDNDHFDIERSDNGTSFTVIGVQPGHGTSIEIHQYRYIDNKPVGGLNYYRLRQVDRNGRHKISTVKSVNISLKHSVIIFHDLSSNTLNIQKDHPESIQIRIYNSGGQLVIEKNTIQNRSTIDISKLSRGLYNVFVRSKNGYETHKFLK